MKDNIQIEKQLQLMRSRIVGLLDSIEKIETAVRNGVPFGMEEPAANTTWQEPTGTLVKDLESIPDGTNFNDVVLDATILQISPGRTFKRKDGTTGSFQSWIIGDATDKTIQVAWWDEMVEKVSEFMKGERIRLTKMWKYEKNNKGVLELNPGKFAKVERL